MIFADMNMFAKILSLVVLNQNLMLFYGMSYSAFYCMIFVTLCRYLEVETNRLLRLETIINFVSLFHLFDCLFSVHYFNFERSIQDSINYNYVVDV